MAARALDFVVCGTINEPHLPADGSIPNQFLCVHCDQKVLATRKHELWECPGNISLCLFSLSLKMTLHTLINVVITPSLKLPSRVAKVSMF